MKIQMIKKLGIVSCLALASAMFLPAPAQAGCNAGFILFGGIKDNVLDYVLDNCNSGQTDRYYLEIKSQKFKVSEVIITYPEHFTGSFDPSDMKLRATADAFGGKELAIESSVWDREARRITIIPKEAIPAKTPLRVVLSNVRNPDYSGFYQLDGRVIGSWMISFD
jgi:hypothetical protein